MLVLQRIDHVKRLFPERLTSIDVRTKAKTEQLIDRHFEQTSDLVQMIRSVVESVRCVFLQFHSGETECSLQFQRFANRSPIERLALR